LDIFSQIGKSVDELANAAGDAVKKINFSEISETIDAAANTAGDEIRKIVDPTAVGAAATGGAVGAGLSATIGGMGLAVGGTAVGIGMAPVVVAGVIVGLGAYGVSKAINPDSKDKE
jgi:hypothetical protein